LRLGSTRGTESVHWLQAKSPTQNVNRKEVELVPTSSGAS
jgi:hypothetical protein